MLSLIRTDLRKLFSLKSFYICIGLITLFSFLMLGILALNADLYKELYNQGVQKTEAGEELDITTEAVYLMVEQERVQYEQRGEEFSIDEFFKTYGISQVPPGDTYTVYILMIAIVASLFVTSEFSQGTMKNVIARGFSRSKIYLSKVAVISILGLIYMIFTKVINIVIFTFVYGFGESIATTSDMVKSVGVEALLIIAFASFFVMIAMVTKSTAGGMSLNIVSCTIFGSLLSLGNIAFKDVRFENYFIEGAMMNLMTSVPENEHLRNGLILSAVYFFGAILIGMITFRKADIK